MADEQPGIVIVDGAGTEHQFPAGFDPQRAAQIVRESTAASAPATPADQSSLPEATALTGMLRSTAPEAIQGLARGAADHPRFVQNIIDAGTRATAGGVGGLIAGEPGAVVGTLSMKGMTPTQGTIRTVAGQMAGEAPEVAAHAGRAQSVINYARPQGIKLTPGNLRSVPENPSLDNYAESMGQKVIRLYAPTGPAGTTGSPESWKQVVGPMTPIDAAEPGLASKVVPGLTRALGYLQAGTGVTDLARMLEPKRQDIGVMGIGGNPKGLPADYNEKYPPLLNVLGSKAAALRDAILQRLSGTP